jgi:hypothetical protein
MDSILKTFSLGFLLRSMFAGVFFVLSYHVASYNFQNLEQVDGLNILSEIFPISLFTQKPEVNGINLFSVVLPISPPCQ